MAGILTNAQLRTVLATKLPGVTVSAATYPDEDSCLPLVAGFLRAALEAQVSQNATAPTGEDVQLVAIGTGTETTITRDDVTHTVRPVTYSVTMYEKYTVDNVLPILA